MTGEPGYSPNNLEQTELQPVAAFGPHAQVREYKEAGVSSTRFCVLQVVQGGNDRPGGTSCLAILKSRAEQLGRKCAKPASAKTPRETGRRGKRSTEGWASCVGNCSVMHEQ